MGEMADFITANLVEQSYDDFGGMRTKTCRYCGTTGLTWKNTNDGWRLFDGDEIHVCQKRKEADDGTTP